MRPSSSTTQSFQFLIYLCILAFIIGFVFDFRAITSISTGAMLLAGIASNIQSRKAFHLSKAEKLFFICLILYFMMQVLGVLYTHDKAAGWARVQIKSGLVLIPLALFSCSVTDNRNWRSLFLSYIIILLLASLYCLVFLTVHIHQPFDPAVFFYHSLVSPLHHHAVYFSIYVFVALVILLESLAKKWMGISRVLHLILIAFFTIFLILLSSKLVIIFLLVYFIFYIISQVRNRKAGRMLIAFVILATLLGSILITVTKNPIKQRFADILNGNMAIVKQDSFDKGDYFNGVQFRLLEWKFVGEILNQRGAWLKGVSPGDAQAALDSLYIGKNMYTGEAARRDRGFLSYNTHNTFLEAILQSGIIGLIIVLLICYSLLRMAWQQKDRGLSFIIALLLAWLFSESAFEAQYGILIFTFFPLFFNAREKNSGNLSIDGTVPVQNQVDWRAETNNPLISVILPTYNRLSMLLEAIASIQAQTYPNWELIIADDGSTDNTAASINKIGDPRIQLIELSHTGHISNLRNAAAKKSKGEWLAFVDSDDLWMPNKLELQLATLKKEKKDGPTDYLNT